MKKAVYGCWMRLVPRYFDVIARVSCRSAQAEPMHERIAVPGRCGHGRLGGARRVDLHGGGWHRLQRADQTEGGEDGGDGHDVLLPYSW